MTSFRLALTHLLHDRSRTAVSVLGAAFAIALIFMQIGFSAAIENTATMLYDRLAFDLLLTSSEYIDFTRAGSLSYERLAQVEAQPGVAAVVPHRGRWIALPGEARQRPRAGGERPV